MGSVPELSIVKGNQRDYTTEFLHKIFEENIIAGCGNRPAIIYNNCLEGEKKISYSLLNSTANRIASFIINEVRVRELQPNRDGDWIIAVCMPPSDNLITILLSILKMGAAYLPLDPTFPSNRFEHILKEARPVFVVYDHQNVDPVLFGDTSAISFDDCLSQSLSFDDANITVDKALTGGNHDLGLVLYTSGSTGVRIPHSVVLNRLKWQWETFPYSSTEHIGVFKTALTFVDSVTEIWGPLLNEMAILVVPKHITRDPSQLVSLLEKYQIERMVLVPTLLKSILIYVTLKKDVKYLNKLKYWICSGETLPTSLAIEFYDYFDEKAHFLCNFYGSTEIMGDVAYFTCEGKEQLRHYDNVPIGCPVSNTVIYLLDGEYRPVKAGTIGELYVSGSNLANGYVNGRDKERFIENPLAVDPKYARLYRTGDYASLRKGAVLYYEGRTDSQVKIRGVRVDLSEIEKYLLEMSGVEKGIILCYHAGKMDQAILAFVEVNYESNTDEVQIEKALKMKLPEYMVPEVIVVDKIPLLINGKIDRQFLMKMYEDSNNNNVSKTFIDYDYTGVSEENLKKAKILFETIGEVIGHSTHVAISLDSNFYELGGNSLNSIYTVAKLRDKGYFVEISSFLIAKSLKGLLPQIKEIKQGDSYILNDQKEEEIHLQRIKLLNEHKDDVIDIICTSFIEKAELEQQLKPNLNFKDYSDLIEGIWNPLVEKGYSFVIEDKNGKIVGISLNFDANDEPPIPSCGMLDIIFEFLEKLETPIRGTLPTDAPILMSFMMATHQDLCPQENVRIMAFMESEVIRVAKEQKCVGILTTNTNALTQQLAENVYGYEALVNYQINQYEVNGTHPFGTAPDSYRAIIHWKKL